MHFDKRAILRLAFAACLVFGAAPVWADTVSNFLAVWDPQGNIWAITVSTTDSESANPQQLYEVQRPGGGDLADPLLQPYYSVMWDSTGTHVSDVFGIPPCDPFCSLGFLSGPDSSLGQWDYFWPGFFRFGQGYVDITFYLAPDLREGGYTAGFWSDPKAAVPEPASLVLMGSGLIGLAAIARRKLRS